MRQADKEHRAQFRELNYRGVARNMFNIFMRRNSESMEKKNVYRLDRNRGYNVRGGNYTLLYIVLHGI